MIPGLPILEIGVEIRGKEGYNTGIAYLNNLARNFLNSSLATDARSVGTDPGKRPVTYEDDSGSYVSSNIKWNERYEGQYKNGDTYDGENSGDFAQMKKSNINCVMMEPTRWVDEDGRTHSASTQCYWYASRGIGSYGGMPAFYIDKVYGSNLSGPEDESNYMVYFYLVKNVVQRRQNGFLRPVFKLKSNIHYIIEDGTKKLVE